MARDFDVAEIAHMCGTAETLSLRPGEFLFREGDDAHAMYVVLKGVLRVLSGSTVYETLREGSVVGEMAIIDEETRSASVIAGTHAELLEIDQDKFLSLVAGNPSFALTVMHVIARRLRIMNRRYRQTEHAAFG